MFLDFGMNFGEMEKYFEEYLKFRSTRGLLDLIDLGLLPDIKDLYRADIVPADSDWRPSVTAKTDAVFISHAHMDHTGYIGFLRADLPVYSSLMTAVISKAIQDTGQSALEKEVTCWKERQAFKDDTRALKSDSAGPSIGRIFCSPCEESIPEAAQAFWGARFSTRSALKSVPITTLKGGVGDIGFEAMPVDHSIYGATGYIFNAGGTTVAYTGDMRLHGRRKQDTEGYIKRLEAVRPDYLIIEGTNVGQAKGNDSETGLRTSEEDAFRNSLREVEAAPGEIVVADFGPRNIDRLEVFLDIAKATGRKLVITPKDAYLLYAMHTVDSMLPDVFTDDDIRVFDAPKAKSDAWEKNFIRPEIGFKYVTGKTISKEPGKYIIAFSFFDLPHLLDVKVPGGVYIYSTCEAFNEDMMADVWRLSHWLEHLKLRPVGFRIEVDEKNPEKSRIIFKQGYHASGHLSKDEVAEIIGRVKPGAVIPIHTEHPDEFKNLISGDVKLIVPEKGKAIPLS